MILLTFSNEIVTVSLTLLNMYSLASNFNVLISNVARVSQNRKTAVISKIVPRDTRFDEKMRTMQMYSNVMKMSIWLSKTSQTGGNGN